MILPHLITSMVAVLGWRGAFRVQALYTSVTIALTGLMFRPVRPAEVAPSSRNLNDTEDPRLTHIDGASVDQPLEIEALIAAEDDNDIVVEVVAPGRQPVKYWHYHRSYLQLSVDRIVLLFVVSLLIYNFASAIPMTYIVSVRCFTSVWNGITAFIY
jgi:hypothetical protein